MIMIIQQGLANKIKNVYIFLSVKFKLPTDCVISASLLQATLCDMDIINFGTTSTI